MTDLTFALLRERNLERVTRWHPSGLGEWTGSDWATATGGELGEAMNVQKKLNRCRDGLPGNEKTEEELHSDLGDELADTLIYLDLWAAASGINLAEAVARKFNKTSIKVGFPERLPE